MFDSGKQEPYTQEDLSTLYHEPADKGPVFPGKPFTPNPYQPGNLAVKRGLMDIFDEFTEVISGELKAMKLEEANRELNPKQPPQTPEP